MAWIRSLVVIVASVAFSSALNISEFQNIAPGIHDDWAKASADNVRNDSESFGLAYAKDKVFVVSRRALAQNDGKLPEASAARGGIVSMLDLGSKAWTHKSYDRLDEDKLEDSLFTLSGRLFMLLSSGGDKIAFSKLFSWDDAQGKWMEVPLEFIDDASQPLARGPEKFVTINVPDLNGNVAFLTATDHQLASTDSETTFSKLEVKFEGAAPAKAKLELIKRVASPLASAAITTAVRNDILHAMVSRFTPDSRIANVSVDYLINLKTKEQLPGPSGLNSTMPSIDFSKDRIFQLKDKVIFLGPHKDIDGKQMRHVWLLDLSQMQWQETDASFPDVPNRVFAVDHDNMKIFAAGLKAGVFAAVIDASQQAPLF
jgi:hypothetical protein